MSEVIFTVRGLPVAQGSARAFIAGKRAIIATDANRTTTPLGAWRTAIANEARAAMGDAPYLSGPLRVTVLFALPRPRSHYLSVTRARPVPVLRDDAPYWHTTTPDVDKLVRALLDALTYVVFDDDKRVAQLRAGKCYDDRGLVGAVINVREIDTARRMIWRWGDE